MTRKLASPKEVEEIFKGLQALPLPDKFRVVAGLIEKHREKIALDVARKAISELIIRVTLKRR